MNFIRIGATASVALLATSVSQASFVGFVVTSSSVELDGQTLSVYTLAARFDGSADTVWRAFDLGSDDSTAFLGFWHKDNHGDTATDGLLSQDFGTWDPRRTGSNLANRPYDSYLTIGGIARSSNATQSAVNSLDGDAGNMGAWSQPSLPSATGFAWYVDRSSTVLFSDENDQGRVGNSPGLPVTDVRLGQFVLSEGHEARTFSLSILFSRGYALSDDKSAPYSTASGTFTLGQPVPGPGSIGLVVTGLLLATRGRRR